MENYTVIYFDTDGRETVVDVLASDAAAALGTVIDEYDDIDLRSPFGVLPYGADLLVSDPGLRNVFGGTGADRASASAASGQPGRGTANAVPPAGNTEIGTGPGDDEADALGAIPLDDVPPELTAKWEQDTHKLLKRIFSGTGLDIEVES